MDWSTKFAVLFERNSSFRAHYCVWKHKGFHSCTLNFIICFIAQLFGVMRTFWSIFQCSWELCHWQTLTSCSSPTFLNNLWILKSTSSNRSIWDFFLSLRNWLLSQPLFLLFKPAFHTAEDSPSFAIVAWFLENYGEGGPGRWLTIDPCLQGHQFLS